MIRTFKLSFAFLMCAVSLFVASGAYPTAATEIATPAPTMVATVSETALSATQAPTVSATAPATSAPTAAAANDSLIGRENFTVNLGDFTTDAQLTYPANAKGPFTTVILIHGSTAADMDFDVGTFQPGVILSHIFKDIADYLALHDVATVRYNKHYVKGFNNVDQQKFATLTLKQMYADVGSVYKVAIANPKVDPKKVVMYGWSEGSPTAALFVADHPEVAGLILQGSVSGSFAETFRAQIIGVGVPYLHQDVDTNKDGKISLDELNAAFRATPGGGVAKTTLYYLLSPDSTAFNLKFNTLFHADANGLLDIDQTIVPTMNKLFDDFDNTFGKSFFTMYTSSQQLPFITDSAKKIKQPALIMHGAFDANTPVSNAKAVDQTLADAGNTSHTLVIYPGLGHSLGKAQSIIEDNFAPIDAQPLKDVVSWIGAHIGTAS